MNINKILETFSPNKEEDRLLVPDGFTEALVQLDNARANIRQYMMEFCDNLESKL